MKDTPNESTITTSEIITRVNALGEFPPINKLKVSWILRTRKVNHVGTAKMIPLRPKARGGAAWQFVYPIEALDVVLRYLRARRDLAVPK